jgi:hypothetical protein
MFEPNSSLTKTSLLSHVFHALSTSDEYMHGLKRLDDALKAYGPARYSRFYYEEILGRSPEIPEYASYPVPVPSEYIAMMLSSDEFLLTHDILLQRSFPHLIREFFLHVPKTGGTTLFYAFQGDSRYCTLQLYPGYDNGWFSEPLRYLHGVICRLTHPAVQHVITYGHPPAARIINNRLKRGRDNVFTILRHPVEGAISWLNYVFTLLAEDPGHPDVTSWRNTLEISTDFQPNDQKKILTLVPHVIDKILPLNPLCTIIGMEGRLQSAIETSIILDVKIVPLQDIGRFLRYRGISDYQPQNVSKKFINLSDVPFGARINLYDKITEDLRFYEWIGRHGIRGEGPWLTLCS